MNANYIGGREDGARAPVAPSGRSQCGSLGALGATPGAPQGAPGVPDARRGGLPWGDYGGALGPGRSVGDEELAPGS